MIELKNVSFRYDKTVEEYQIDTVSFHVKQGEWLSIVGHNGSGKSTVVRLIDGLLEAESGEIYIDGKQLSRETIWEIRSKIGIVFQNPDNQFVGATVEDDVAFGLENQCNIKQHLPWKCPMAKQKDNGKHLAKGFNFSWHGCSKNCTTCLNK